VEALRTLGPVVAAAGSDGGTTMLVRRPPRAIAARFGPGSLRRHRESAEARDLPFAEVRAPELAFDLDKPEDLGTFLRAGPPGRTRDLLLELGAGSWTPAHA
jgi:2-phospho-L-lactate guanylyltransferase (CobY/MobA/RfbA family)